MGADNEIKIQLLKKIKTLADRGTGGEKEAAQKKLEILMRKYGIDSLDLSKDTKRQHEFRYHGYWEKRLLIQILYKIIDTTKMYRYKHGQGSRSMLFADCTDAQAAQIQIEFDFYSDLWKEELNTFFAAFVGKHKIWGKSEIENACEPSAEELLRRSMMADAMRDKTLNPMIEWGGDDDD